MIHSELEGSWFKPYWVLTGLWDLVTRLPMTFGSKLVKESHWVSGASPSTVVQSRPWGSKILDKKEQKRCVRCIHLVTDDGLYD